MVSLYILRKIKCFAKIFIQKKKKNSKNFVSMWAIVYEKAKS